MHKCLSKRLELESVMSALGVIVERMCVSIIIMAAAAF